MTTLLTILDDDSRASMYETLMREAGVEVIHAEGALHALTQLERVPVDAIICDPHMEDMTGEDFKAVVAEEAHTASVPVFILPDSGVLSGQQGLETSAPSGPQLLTRVLGHLQTDAALFPAPMNPAAKAQLQGDLATFSLPELLNWVSEMRLHGHWLVTVQDSPGNTRSAHLFMKDGTLVYAEYAGLIGKAGLFALMRAIEQQPQATFRFLQLERPLILAPSDLGHSTARLLMELAVDLDHLQVGHAAN